MCGENLTMNNETKRDVGSPPHVRGKHPEMDSGNVVAGITPACAGKTNSGSPCIKPAEDHPRMCGENLNEVVGAYLV